jgi:hypothetical protein
MKLLLTLAAFESLSRCALPIHWGLSISVNQNCPTPGRSASRGMRTPEHVARGRESTQEQESRQVFCAGVAIENSESININGAISDDCIGDRDVLPHLHRNNGTHDTSLLLMGSSRDGNSRRTFECKCNAKYDACHSPPATVLTPC